MHRPQSALIGFALIAGALPLGVAFAASGASAAPGNPAVVGSFGPVFSEPTGHECRNAKDPAAKCKPAAMAVAQLPNGKVVYWDGLEGMNKVEYNVVAELADVAQNDQSRVMDLRTKTWTVPAPEDSGANRGGIEGQDEFLPGVPHQNDNKANDGDLFCSDLTFLTDGRILVGGGTGYYQEPGVPGTKYGVAELQGLRNGRIFDPKTNTWKQTGQMKYGRWYPSLVALPNGNVFVASGVTKLIKPVYPNHPEDSGSNVKQTETFNPRTGKWTVNPASADKSLPLYPRLHLLPDGKVYYDPAGQTFNPMGQSYDEALWNLTSVYDPRRQSWKDLGVPVIGGLPLGFRGSGFSVMLPLQPDSKGRYTQAGFLSGGGVIGVSPGSYLATDTATLNTVDTADGHAFTSEATGTLTQPRWYGTGVVLPDGKVFLVNGASRDEVVLPGTGEPILGTEIWDPRTGQWTPTATQTNGRTYHNTAMLLPDGRVLVGGHAPIATGYAFQDDTGRELLGLSRSTADPTFQIYSPPYLHWGKRPVITKAPSTVPNSNTMTIAVDSPSKITSVRLVRNTALTHLVDSDQRTVDLRIVKRSGNDLTLAVPDANVLTPGPYMLFANRTTSNGEIPSVSRQVLVGGSAAGARSIECRDRTSRPCRTGSRGASHRRSGLPGRPARRARRARGWPRSAPPDECRPASVASDHVGQGLTGDVAAQLVHDEPLRTRLEG
jgi:hypothetical protein